MAYYAAGAAAARYGPKLIKWAARSPVVTRAIKRAGGTGLRAAWNTAAAGVRAIKRRRSAPASGGRPGTPKRQRMGQPKNLFNRPRRKRKYFTHGRSAGTIKRAPSKSVGKFIKNGVVRKRESRFILNDPQCCYTGHNSVSVYDTITLVFDAIARMFAKKMGMDFTDIQAGLGAEPSTIISGFQWVIGYKTTFGGNRITAAFGSAINETWAVFAQRLGEGIMAIANAGGTPLNYFELIDIECKGTLSNYPAPITRFYAADIKIQIVGNSSLQIQNRTVATTDAADPDRDDGDNIAANPMHGKMYTGKGQTLTFAWNNDNAGTTIAFQADLITATANIGAANALLSTQMQQALKKPPPYRHFRGLTGQQYCKLEPGEIKRSHVSSTMKFTFQSFIQRMLPVLRTQVNYATMVGAGSQAAASLYLGKWSLIGMEKLCDSGTDEPDCSLASEHTLTTSVLATGRTRPYCAPQVFGV